ncbi:zinc finger protein jing [Anopheles nili]|uniref:zinc finger protein jing n=1 Tax=Anopheles nili TaxID=185578 RepID=UPI00237ABB81|nr:zinc finger protein jing [Anopheles nili]
MALLTPTTPSSALTGPSELCVTASLKSFDLKHGFCLPDDTMDVCYGAVPYGLNEPKLDQTFSVGSECGQAGYTPISAPPTFGFTGCSDFTPAGQFQQPQDVYKQPTGFYPTPPKGDDLFFKFDPEYIERLQSSSSILLSPAATVASTPLTCHSLLSCASSCTTTTDYYNYNDTNCQSKNQSPCSSPFTGDPWIESGFSLNMMNLNGSGESVGRNSPKRNNVEMMVCNDSPVGNGTCTTLPSIRSAFGGAINGQFEGVSSVGKSTTEPAVNYMMDFFDTSFLEQYGNRSGNCCGTTSDTCTEPAPAGSDAYSYASENYFKPTQATEKPNREFKDIWREDDTPEPSVPLGTLLSTKQEPLEPTDELVTDPEELFSATCPRSCLWSGCNMELIGQQQLVEHIEKQHVEPKRGEVFGCQWLHCPRQHRPFNARYKLLIHMRVHSGEKPNKCPFPSCSKAFSRLENLKIHQRSHTGERPYNCQFQGCLKAFSNSSDRAKHQRTHYDTKPYACQLPGCSKRYTDPSSLRKHVKNHGARPAEVTMRNKVALPQDAPAGRRHSEPSMPTDLADPSCGGFEVTDALHKPSNLAQENVPNSFSVQRRPTMDDFNDLSSCLVKILQQPAPVVADGNGSELENNRYLMENLGLSFENDASYATDDGEGCAMLEADMNGGKGLPSFASEFDYFGTVV